MATSVHKEWPVGDMKPFSFLSYYSIYMHSNFSANVLVTCIFFVTFVMEKWSPPNVCYAPNLQKPTTFSSLQLLIVSTISLSWYAQKRKCKKQKEY